MNIENDDKDQGNKDHNVEITIETSQGRWKKATFSKMRVPMGFDIRVAAAGIVALCLVLSAIMFLSSVTILTLEAVGRMFFGLAVMLIVCAILLALIGVKVRFP
jgi:hypothetical protein